MKKIIMTLVAATMMAASASAQVYMGGSIGIASIKNGNNDSETTYKVLPEIGYNFNKEWAIGASFGYQKGACDLLNGSYGQDVTTKAFSFNPYARYTFVHSKYVNVFCDGGLTFTDYDDYGTGFGIGLRPGVAVNLSDKLSFVTHIGFVGYNSFNPDAKGIDKSNAVGVDLSGENITFGLYYNF